jgi:transcriptional regulator with XRE-family HTH domain
MSGSDEVLPGRTLALMRIAWGWDQQQLARAAGVHRNTISDYENDRPSPTRGILVRLARAMGMPEHLIERTLAFQAEFQPVDPSREASLEQKLEALVSRQARLYEAGLRQTTFSTFREAIALLERELAEELWLRLMQLPQEARQLAAEEEKRFHRWALAERLSHESAAAAGDEKEPPLELAKLAVVVVERMKGEEGWRSRVLGYATAFLANALRVGGDLPAADRAFQRARSLWHAGAATDPGLLDESRLWDLEASLRRAQRRLPESLACLEEALRWARPEGVARLLVKKAKSLEETGAHEEALAILDQALPRISAPGEPRLFWTCRLNAGVNLCALGRANEAEALLPELGELTLQLGNGLDRLRFRWLQAKVHAGYGRRGEAILALTEVRDEFLARGIAYDAALASLELAVLLLEVGQASEVREVAARLAPVFAAQEVYREALAALRVFCAAAEAEAATAAETRRILGFLLRARCEAGLLFERAIPGTGPEA